MDIQDLDLVQLKDGREGTIVWVIGGGQFLLDVGSSPEDWDTIYIREDDIERVINRL